MHAATVLATVSSIRQCGPYFGAISDRLEAAVHERDIGSIDSSAQNAVSQDFRSLPAMREHLQLALERFKELAINDAT